MRTTLVRQRLVRSAVMAVSVALLAACAGQRSPGAQAPPPSSLAVGTLLVSNGTATVTVGGKAVTFPTTVTDATWSADGSRIAFVDQEGNISTARPDGSGRVVLTERRDGVTRSRPTWSVLGILYEERAKDGQIQLMQVAEGVVTKPGSTRVFEPEMEEPTGNSAASGTGLGDGVDLAFQHQGRTGPEVWVADYNQRAPWAEKVADGSEPAISPDGTKLAFVAPNGQVSVMVLQAAERTQAQITFGVESPSHLAWSPEGNVVAFSTRTDIGSVSATVPAGATTNAVTRLSTSAGVATFLRPARDRVVRIAGTDAIATSIAASQSQWPAMEEYVRTESSAPAGGAVLLGTGNLPAALGGAMLAQTAHGPVLFTGAGALDPRVKAELKRTLGRVVAPETVPTVFLVGGVDVVSPQAEAEVKAMGYETRRIAGTNQYEVAAAVRDSNSLPPDIVYVADGEDPAGQAAVASLTRHSTTVILSHGSELAQGAKTFLNKLRPEARVIAVGSAASTAASAPWAGKPSTLAVTLTSVAELGGELFGWGPVVVADASSKEDLAIAIAMAISAGGRVVVPEPSGLNQRLAAWLDGSSAAIDTVLVVDSTAKIGRELEAQLGGLVGGPLGYSVASNPAAPSL